jgi:hypothetical protein
MKLMRILPIGVLLFFVLAITACHSQDNPSQIHPIPATPPVVQKDGLQAYTSNARINISVNPPVNQKDGWQMYTCSEEISGMIAEGEVL